MKNKPEPLKIAHFRFALIAPVIQGLYPDASEAAYYRRVTQDPILRPDGVSYKYSPDTLERWTGLYRKKGMDGLIPGFRKDKGVSRALSADAINEIYRLREKFPRINGVMIHQMLVQSGFIDAKVSVRAVQRFLKENDLRSARNPAVKDRKAYEMPEFGCMWQADYPDVSFIPIFSAAQRYNALDKRKHRDKISYNRPYAFLKSTSDISLTSDSFLRRGWFWSVAASIAFLFISVSAYA